MGATMSRLDLDLARAVAEIQALFATVPEIADDEDLRRDMIEGATDATELLRRIVRMRADAEAMAAAVRVQEHDLRQRRERFDARADAMKALAERIMNAADLSKITLPEATLSFRATPPAVVITDPSEVPENMWRVKREIDKAAVKEALQSDEPVPGAYLTNGGRTLAIRVL